MFSLVHARLLPNRQRFDVELRFELQTNGITRHGCTWETVEIIVHHDTYTRTVTLPFVQSERYDYATFVQYGHGIDFSEIEVSLIDNHGGRTEPQFYTVPRQPVIELKHRKAKPEELAS